MGKRKKSAAELRAKSDARRVREARRRERLSPLEFAMEMGRRAQQHGGPALPLETFHALSLGVSGEYGFVGSAAYTPLRRLLRDCDRTSTVAAISGLLTVPTFHAGTLRLEMALHTALTSCRGTRRVGSADVVHWVNDLLGGLPIRNMEDPVEDVFISNVMTPDGNFRLFEGTWELNDASLQSLIDVLSASPWAEEAPIPLAPIVALLRLSEALAERANLPRWTTSEERSPTSELLPPEIDLESLRELVTFPNEALTALEIYPEDTAPFLIAPAHFGRIRNECLGHTTLERFPLLPTKAGIVLACPTAVSAAIRRYILEVCTKENCLEGLTNAMRWVNERAVFRRDLPRHLQSVELNKPAVMKDPAVLPKHRRWREEYCAFDVDKTAVVMVLTDSMAERARIGLIEPFFDRELNQQLIEHLPKVANHLASIAAGGGLFVMVRAGLGGGTAMSIPHLPPNWHVLLMSAGDFALFARAPESSLLRLWKLEQQRARLKTAGLDIPDSNGVLNTYTYWISRDFSLCPTEMTFPPIARSLVHIGTEFICDFRVEERRQHDVHAVPLDAAGRAVVRVHRRGRSVFFDAMAERPLYLSEHALAQKRLMGVCEHKSLVVWVIADRGSHGAESLPFLYQLWDSVLSWFDRLVPEIVAVWEAAGDSSRYGLIAASPVLRVHLALSADVAWASFGRPEDVPQASPTSSEGEGSGDIVITIPFGFLTMVRRPTNDGERTLLEAIANAMLKCLFAQADQRDRAPSISSSFIEDESRACVTRVMVNDDSRFIHVFDAVEISDQISRRSHGQDGEARLSLIEDRSSWTAGLAWKVLTQPSETDETSPDDVANHTNADGRSIRRIVGKAACTRLLNGLVDVLWKQIGTDLALVDRESLIVRVLGDLEDVVRDRKQWKRTARAILALYGASEDVAATSANREAARATASMAGRILIEMAVCTSPTSGGRRASISETDRLLSGVAELLNLAFLSDAINSDLGAAEIRVFPNGSIDAHDAFLRDIVHPYAMDTHRSAFHEAAEDYASSFRGRIDSTAAKGEGQWGGEVGEAAESTNEEAPGIRRFEPDYAMAFAEEFELTPDQTVDAFAELLSLAVESDSLVVRTSRGVIANRLTANRSFSTDEVRAFFGLFALMPRSRWEQAPPGFLPRDWQPWRFRRRLSLVARPLVALGPIDDASTPLIFGVDHLESSLSYLFDGIRSGWLPGEFFRTQAMLRYRGSVVDSQGRAFTLEVADAMRGAGWHARTELELTTIGGSPALGDLDVVAWRDSDPRLLLIECKRLQPAKTVGEIAEQLKQFRGVERDALAKHLHRLEWIHENRSALGRYLGVDSTRMEPVALLVTNRHVPMSYRANLPLSPNRIVPLAELTAALTNGSV